MRTAGAFVVWALLGATTACSTAPGSPAVAPAVPVGNQVSARFRPALQKISAVRSARASGNGAATARQTNELLSLGIQLLQARTPHDVARPDVPRYDAARQAFGEALKELTYARDAGDMRALDAALDRLEGATRRWSDAHLGLPAETTL